MDGRDHGISERHGRGVAILGEAEKVTELTGERVSRANRLTSNRFNSGACVVGFYLHGYLGLFLCLSYLLMKEYYMGRGPHLLRDQGGAMFARPVGQACI